MLSVQAGAIIIERKEQGGTLMNNSTNRSYWLELMVRVAKPVLQSMAARQLKLVMPIESKIDRSQFTHLEALGRTLAGIAPWLEQQAMDSEEESLRVQFSQWARQSMDAATDPESPDYCNFTGHGASSQTLVDTAFLAHAIVRAPNELWGKLDDRTKKHVTTALLATRSIRPAACNWLLFSGMVEAALHLMGVPFDTMRVDYAVRQHEQWYKGDGAYGDGPDFHWDYYNSYVIQPMLIDLLQTVGFMYTEGSYSHASIQERILARARRYGAVQEKLISPEGTFPAIGRSIAYRTGAFQLLAQLALMKELPSELSPAQVRCALQAVMHRCLEGASNYDENGWLKIGLSGSQPSLGETYISTGSLYLCSTVFLPMGLSAADPFWSLPDEPWSSQLIWSGVDQSADHAFHGG
jgi:hypothetical protein